MGGSDTLGAHWRLLRRDPLQAEPWFDLAAGYAALGLPLQAGYVARQAAMLAPRRAGELDALPIGPWRDDPSMGAVFGSGVPDAALAQQFEQGVADYPGDWLGWLFLARLREAMSHDAGQALVQAQGLEPIAGESLHWLGRWRLAADDATGAVAALSQLLDIRPVRCGSMMLLGEALLRVNNVAAAEKAFARASLSNNPGFLLELATFVCGRNYWREALEVLDKALALQPDSVPHLVKMATIQHDVYALEDCRVTIARVRALDPGNREVAPLEWGMHGRMGDARRHLAALQEAYASGGDPLSRLASSIAMVALYDDAQDASRVAALHRDLCAPINAAWVAKTDFTNPRTAHRRLRIGYITGDLHRQHPVNLFMLPILQRHDHGRFDIRVYDTGTFHDEYTRMAKRCCDGWTSAEGMSDATLQRAIVDDGIDILVDLAGHCSSHRLGVFAMRAAPVQATFLGYPHSTGLSTMDWLIGDAVVSPEQHAHLFSEAIVQLPGSVFCWAPVDDYPLPPARPAAAPLVFGSFNNVLKLSPATIAMWARILHAVPDALLLLKSPSFDDAGVRTRFTRLFGEHGVQPARLLFRGPSGLEAMMQEYGEIDIALDPTPYNGGTTTLQALWMGVPTVTLEGANFVSRMGASFMRTLGRPEWVAADADGYVAAAVGLAQAREAVRSARAALRERMQRSPVSDIDAYVRHFEAALSGMWLSYCERDGRRLLTRADVAVLAQTLDRAA